MNPFIGQAARWRSSVPTGCGWRLVLRLTGIIPFPADFTNPCGTPSRRSAGLQPIWRANWNICLIHSWEAMHSLFLPESLLSHLGRHCSFGPFQSAETACQGCIPVPRLYFDYKDGVFFAYSPEVVAGGRCEVIFAVGDRIFCVIRLAGDQGALLV